MLPGPALAKPIQKNSKVQASHKFKSNSPRGFIFILIFFGCWVVTCDDC
jgi:hypothetical protein